MNLVAFRYPQNTEALKGHGLSIETNSSRMAQYLGSTSIFILENLKFCNFNKTF